MKLPFNPAHISSRIFARLGEPQTKITLAVYLLASAYLVFHVVFLDAINPVTIAVFLVWVTL